MHAMRGYHGLYGGQHKSLASLWCFHTKIFFIGFSIGYISKSECGVLSRSKRQKLQNGLHAHSYKSNKSAHGTHQWIENFKTFFSLSTHCYLGMWRLRINNALRVKSYDPPERHFSAVSWSSWLAAVFVLACTP